jgi:hypothetical protein
MANAQICKGCGLEVTPGYPKCPRCRMPLPTVEAPLATATRASEIQGGTSVDDGGSSWLPWAIAAVLLAGGVAALALLFGGEEESKPAPAEVAEVATEVPEEEQQAPGVPAPKASEPEKDSAKTEALETLQNNLNGANLWATVTIAGDDDAAVSVRSASCDDAEIRPVLAEAGPGLKSLGFSSVRCLAEHGELIFETEL